MKKYRLSSLLFIVSSSIMLISSFSFTSSFVNHDSSTKILNSNDNSSKSLLNENTSTLDLSNLKAVGDGHYHYQIDPATFDIRYNNTFADNYADGTVIGLVRAGSNPTAEDSGVTWIGLEKNFDETYYLKAYFRRAQTNLDEWDNGWNDSFSTSNSIIGNSYFFNVYTEDGNNRKTIWPSRSKARDGGFTYYEGNSHTWGNHYFSGDEIFDGRWTRIIKMHKGTYYPDKYISVGLKTKGNGWYTGLRVSFDTDVNQPLINRKIDSAHDSGDKSWSIQNARSKGFSGIEEGTGEGGVLTYAMKPDGTVDAYSGTTDFKHSTSGNNNSFHLNSFPGKPSSFTIEGIKPSEWFAKYGSAMISNSYLSFNNGFPGSQYGDTELYVDIYDNPSGTDGYINFAYKPGSILKNGGVVDNQETHLCRYYTFNNFGSSSLTTTLKPNADSNGNFIFNSTQNFATIDWTNQDSIINSLKKNIALIWKDDLFNNAPIVLPSSGLNIVIDAQRTKGADGKVVITSLSSTNFFDQNGSQGTNINLIPNGKSLTITGLNRIPTRVQIGSYGFGTIELSSDGWYEWNAAKFFEANSTSYSTVLPSEFRADQSNLSLWPSEIFNKFLINVPNSIFSDPWGNYQSISRVNHDYTGTIDQVIKIKGYNDINGQLSNQWWEIKIRLVGLKKKISWNDSLNSSGSYSYQLPQSSPLQSKPFQSINEQDLKTFILANSINFFTPLTESITSLTPGTISKSGNSITLSNWVVNYNGYDTTLPNLTINNFILAGINLTPKSSVTSYPSNPNLSVADMYAAQVSSALLDPNQSQENLKILLSQIYDGTDNIDLTQFKIHIISSKCNSLTGGFDVNLRIEKNDDLNVFYSYYNNFLLPKTGITSLKNYQAFVDLTSTQIQEKLNSQADTYIKSLNIVDGILNIGTTISASNIQVNNDKSVSATISASNSWVDQTTVGANSKELGTLTIYGNDYAISQTKVTSWYQKYDFTSNPLFNDVSSPQKFKEVIDANLTNESVINSLIGIVNKPDSATIKMISSSISGNDDVVVNFQLSQYYDETGNLIDAVKDISLTYKLISNVSNETTINLVNQLPSQNPKYAFQYTNEELSAISGLIVNKPDGAVVQITNPRYDNLGATIIANVSIDKYYDRNGELQNQPLTVNDVKFYGSKVPTSASTIYRNDVSITETSVDVEQLISSQDTVQQKAFISKYVAITPSDINTTFEVVPGSLKPYTGNVGSDFTKIGAYEIKLVMKNYFAADANLTYTTTQQTEQDATTIVFYVIPKNETVLTEEVILNGISATNPIDQYPVDEVVANTPSITNDIKEWIIANFDRIFENYSVSNPTVSEITNISFSKIDNEVGAVNVTLTLANANTISGIAPVEFTFKITNLGLNVWTLMNNPIVIEASSLNSGNSTKFASAFATESSNDFVSIVTTEIKTNNTTQNYFTKLPSLESNDNIVQVSCTVDDVNGKIIVSFKLPKFYVKGVVETPTSPSDNPNALVYQAIIQGFKKEDDKPFAAMDRNIDAQRGQLNDSINKGSTGSFEKVTAFDYKTAIKDKINTFLSAATSMPSSVLEAAKSEMANFDSNATVVLGAIATSGSRAIGNVTSTATVTYPQLATITGDETWNEGYVFNITNATYANTDVTCGTQNLNMTISQFEALGTVNEKINALSATINFLAPEIFSGEDYTNPTGLQIDKVSGDPKTGKAIVKFTFNKFYINNKVVDNYEINFNFNFKSEVENNSTNFIKDEAIAGTTLDPSWDGTNTTITAIYAGIIGGSINVNDILTNKKDVILNADIATKYPNLVLEYKDVALSTEGSNNYLLIDVGVKTDSNSPSEVIEQLKVGPFTFTMPATNPTAVASVPSDVTFDSLPANSGDNVTGGTTKGKLIDFTEGKTVDTNADIAITSATLDQKQKTDKYQVAFVDFTFNGVYLKENNIKSFVANYVVKLRMDFTPAGKFVASEIVWSGPKDQYISASISNPKNNNWIIYVIISALFISLVAVYVARTLYLKNKSKKANEEK